MPESKTSWSDYLHEFHGDRPGITEALLERCTNDEGTKPYDWFVQAVQPVDPVDQSADGGAPLVIDMGGGNGPVAERFDRWVGVDVSQAELAEARRRGRGPVTLGAGEAMPIASDRAALVLSVMSLMVVDDPAAALAEAARMLGPGGRLAILLPAQKPLKVRDVLRYGLLLVALGRFATPFPHRDVGKDLHRLLIDAGFAKTGDDNDRFGFAMDAPDSASLLIDALYLPNVSDRRVRIAKWFAGHWGTTDMGLALRRVTARLRPT